MGKRIRLDEPSDTAPKAAKKQKYDTSRRDGLAEEVVSARQLQSLLVFEQDQAQSLRCTTNCAVDPSPADDL